METTYLEDIIAWVKCKKEFCRNCWQASCDVGKPDLEWAAKIMFARQTTLLVEELIRKGDRIMTIDEAYMLSYDTLIMYEIYTA